MGALGVLFANRDAQAIAKAVPPGISALDPADPQAKALSYVPDVTEIDSNALKLKVSPAEAGQRCSNCQLFSGVPGADWGPCAIFSYRIDPVTKKNYVVMADGWCRSWAPRQG
jgi:hypothetical protein